MEKEYVVKIDSTGSTFEYGQEIIRCEDCENYYTDDCAMAFEHDGKQTFWNNPDDFCSWGVRKR